MASTGNLRGYRRALFGPLLLRFLDWDH